jgi:hypothetical protein
MTIVDGIKVKDVFTIGAQPLFATRASNIYD